MKATTIIGKKAKRRVRDEKPSPLKKRAKSLRL